MEFLFVIQHKTLLFFNLLSSFISH